MKKERYLFLSSVFGSLLGIILITSLGFCEEHPAAVGSAEESSTPLEVKITAGQGEQKAVTDNLDKADTITLDFKEADIRNVLKIISMKAGVNIIATPEVMGNVTVRLVEVPWETALDVILKTYGFGYDKQHNIIMIAPIAKLTEQKKQEVELAQVQPTQTEVFVLKYLDAQDAEKALQSQLSPRGKITVLAMSGQSGWSFASYSKGESLAVSKRESETKVGRSKVLIISDIPPVLDKIRVAIDKIDVQPKQVLIEAKIMEVSRDKLKDIGLDFGTSSGGATSTTVTPVAIGKDSAGLATDKLGGNMLNSQVKPSVFGPKATNITGITPFNSGLSLLFQKLDGTQFSAMLHALEEDVLTNTLSSPRIMTLNNQEATIVVGTKYPILKTDTTGSTAAVSTKTLDYYQDIGVQLRVVPQVGANNSINMVVHPVISSYTNTLGDNAYPIIDVREAETRVLMKDGETVVIGGLLKDVKSKGITGIPFISKIPFLGVLFRRETIDTEKIELLVFISATVVKGGELSQDEIAKMEAKFSENKSFKKESVVKKKRK